MNTIFRNFLTTLKRFKLATSLNVIGLSVAYTAFLVIIMQVNFEYSFDKQYADSDRIYRVNSKNKNFEGGIVSKGAYEVLEKASPAIEDATFVEMNWGMPTYMIIEKNGQQVGYNEVTDKAWDTFPKFFNLKLVDGDFEKFKEPNALIIPKSIAIKLFGDPFVAGRKIMLHAIDGTPCEVAAVFEDIAPNTQINNVIYSSFPKNKHLGDWGASNYMMYVKLIQGATTDQVTAEFDKVDAFKLSGWIEGFTLSKMTDIYFDKKEYYGEEYLSKKGDIETTNLLLAIGILIIVIAGINFVNFSTSLAPLRIKSINTQKVLGSPTGILRGALVGEAVGISIISYLFALVWIYCLVTSPWQNITTAGIAFEGNAEIFIATAIISLVVGLIAGIYPAYYTTKFPPALILKGSFAMSKSGRALRLGLVGFQFVVSISLIIGAMFLQIQNGFMRKMDKGFDSDQIVIATLSSDVIKARSSFENQLKINPNISDIAYCQFRMGRDNIVQGWSRNFEAQESTSYDASVNFNVVVVSWNFPQVMGMELEQGEFLQQTAPQNIMYFMFNEVAAIKYNINAGKRFDLQDSTYSEINAILKDYNFKSLHKEVEPMALVVSNYSWTGDLPHAFIKISGDYKNAIDHIRKVFTEIDPTYPIEIEFFDAGFEQMYAQDVQVGRVVTFFSLLAIIISLVGVFGLIVFETQYKRKEIGVRKIMGSTVSQILVMLNKKFFYIVLVCFAIAAPLAYLGVDAWLGGFAYRTPMFWWVFALGGLIVLIITVITVTVQSYRAATENPVKSLKSE